MSDIAFPSISLPAPEEVEWGIAPNTQESQRSPLNASTQTLGQPGTRWLQRFNYSTLEEEDAALFEQFLMMLNGKEHRALLPMFARPVPRGTIALSGVSVDGAVVFGATSVDLSGCGAGATLLPGDFFAINHQVVMVVGTSAFTADGSGDMAGVNFRPFVRPVAGWADNASVVTDRPTARYMQETDESLWRTSSPIFTDFTFSFVEAFQ